MQENEIEFEDLIYKVFNEYPKPPNSIVLELDNENKDSEFIFQNCLEIFRLGMLIKYGENNKVNLENITEKQFNIINDYFKSFGIQIIIEIDPENVSRYIINKQHLNQHSLFFHTGSKIYKISFDYYI